MAGDRSMTATFSRGFAPGRQQAATGYRLTCEAPRVFVAPPLGPGWANQVEFWQGGARSVDGPRSPLVLSFEDSHVNGVTFSCTVQALTATGVGTPSAPQDVTPLGPPRIESAGTFDVNADRGLFYVNISLEGGDRSTLTCAIDVPGTVTPSPSGCGFETSGLEPDTEYTATVTPTTNLGTGPPHTFTFTTKPAA